MWFMVSRWPQSQEGDWARPHLCNTHTHTRLTALCPGLPRWASTRQVKPIWILLKQKIVSGSGISWAICKSAPCSRQITTPAPHYSVFYRVDVSMKWPAQKRFIRDHVWRGRLKPGCQIVGSVTTVWLTSKADDQSSFHSVIVSTDVMSDHIGRRDAA